MNYEYILCYKSEIIKPFRVRNYAIRRGGNASVSERVSAAAGTLAHTRVSAFNAHFLN